jgi:hypothetical protein
MPHVQLVEHAKLLAAPVWVEAWLEELHAPLAYLLSMPLVVHIIHALCSDSACIRALSESAMQLFES